MVCSVLQCVARLVKFSHILGAIEVHIHDINADLRRWAIEERKFSQIATAFTVLDSSVTNLLGRCQTPPEGRARRSTPSRKPSGRR